MLSERTWRVEAVVRLLLGLFVLFALIRLANTFLEPLLLEHLFAGDKTLFRMVLNAVSFQGTALLLIALFLREERLRWGDAFGFDAGSRARAVWTGLAAGVFVVPAAWMLQQGSVWLMNWFSLDPQSQEIVKNFRETMAQPAAGGGWLRRQMFFGFSVMVFAPVVEEMLFRGLIYPTFKQLGRARTGLWVTALLFAGLHSNLPSFLPFVMLSLVLTWIYEWTDNLLASVVTHAFFNAVNFFYMLHEEAFTRFLSRWL